MRGADRGGRHVLRSVRCRNCRRRTRPPAPASVDDTAPIPRTTKTPGGLSAVRWADPRRRVLRHVRAQGPSQPRDHWSEQPVPWVGGVCDKGSSTRQTKTRWRWLQQPTGSWPSSSSATASPVRRTVIAPRWQHRGRRATVSRRQLAPSAGTSPAAAISYWTEALEARPAEANAAAVGVAHTLGDPVEPPSCTFVAAVMSRCVDHRGLVWRFARLLVAGRRRCPTTDGRSLAGNRDAGCRKVARRGRGGSGLPHHHALARG